MKYLIPSLLLLLFLVVPEQAFALPELVTCQTAEACNFCALAQMIQAVINWVIGVAILIAVILFVYAGFKITSSRGDMNAVSEARQLFTNVVIGIIIMLAAWTLVDTLIKAVVGGDFGVWNEITDCGAMFGAAPPEKYAITLEEQVGVYAVEGPESVVVPGTGMGTGYSNQLTQAQAEALLTYSAFSVSSSGNCTDRTNKTCTSFEGINNATIQGILQFQDSCNCPIVITGGTETGHAAGTYSHANGYKIDIRPSSQINSYITTNYKKCGTRGGYCDQRGHEYVRENAGLANDHWDITVK